MAGNATTLSARHESLALARPFRISRGVKTAAEVVTVAIGRDGKVGRGEGVPYQRYGESVKSALAAIEAQRGPIEAGASRHDLLDLMPAGAARNALDCALWDLEARLTSRSVFATLGLKEPLAPIPTALTVGLDPEAMRAQAAKHSHRPLLKIKLGTPDDMPRLEAVRAGAPDATIIIDANEGWSAEVYADLAPHLVRLGVALVEQPLPAGGDDALLGMDRPVPVCADESCHDRASLPGLKGKYDVVNIKLDKTGGLTEALALRDAARAEGFDVMVGCMVGSSLAMAPATLVAQGAKVVDLDGPLLLAEDRDNALKFDGAGVHPPVAALWG